MAVSYTHLTNTVLHACVHKYFVHASNICCCCFVYSCVTYPLLANFLIIGIWYLFQVLSGCGVNDGSEIHEVVSILSHVTRNNAIPCVFAPDKLQVDVIDHYKVM